VWAFRFLEAVRSVEHSCRQAAKFAARTGFGKFYDRATVREVPAGPLPTNMISVRFVNLARLALAIFHPPNEMVLVVPSVVLCRRIAVTFTLGG
jgi:hypothetical protein